MASAANTDVVWIARH